VSKKRRQRSTAIRKRIEKKQREEVKQAKKRAKRGGGADEDVLLRMEVARQSATACAAAITDLEERLAASPIRGWTANDLGGEHGLAWLGSVIAEAAEAQPDEDPLRVGVWGEAKQPLLDRLSALEMAAPGLDLDWEAGFAKVAFALGRAEEPDEDEEDEPASSDETDEDDDASDGEDAADDDASSDEDDA